MAQTVTLSSLRTQVRQRCDMVGSNFVTDSELNGYINASARELYDLLVRVYGEDYYLSSYSLSTVSGTDEYDLPATFYKLRGVDAQINGSDWETLKKFNFNERNNWQNVAGWTSAGLPNVRYRIYGNKIRFSPAPLAVHSVKLWYIPSLTALSLDADTFDGINGWEEYVVVDAAIKCLQKEESDVSILLAQKEALKQRIENSAENRDAGEPERITDIYAPDYDWFDFGGSDNGF